jgi:hypothetical protein
MIHCRVHAAVAAEATCIIPEIFNTVFQHTCIAVLSRITVVGQELPVDPVDMLCVLLVQPNENNTEHLIVTVYKCYVMRSSCAAKWLKGGARQ